MKNKVLVVNKYFYHVGGIEEFTRNISLLKDKYVSVKVIACSSRQKLNEEIAYRDVNIYKTNFVVFNTPISFGFIFALIKEYFKNDIIHLNSPFPVAEFFVSILTFLKKKKIIVTYHSDVLRQKVVFTILKPFIKILFKRSIVVSTSEFLLKSKILDDIKNKMVIPLGQKDLSEGFVKDYSMNGYCLFVGRLVYYKGLFILLDAMKKFPGKLKVVGTGPLESLIKEYIQDNNLGDRVEMLGFVSNDKLINLYKNASFFVFPSIEKTEAFGIVQINAMNFGLPIINTRLETGVPWVARNNIEAITVKPGDPNELVEAMIALYNNSLLRERLGTAGRKRFFENFVLEKMINSYLNLYKS